MKAAAKRKAAAKPAELDRNPPARVPMPTPISHDTKRVEVAMPRWSFLAMLMKMFCSAGNMCPHPNPMMREERYKLHTVGTRAKSK